MNSFAARKANGPRCMAALAQVILGVFDIVQIDPAHSARASCREIGCGPVAAVAVAIDKSQSLKPTALSQLAAHLGDEAIEEAVILIFGLIDDAGARIDRGGFVPKAAHGLKRNGRNQSCGARWHFEHPAMGHDFTWLRLEALRDDDYVQERGGQAWVGQRSGRRLAIGAAVRVIVTNANPVEGLIDLELDPLIGIAVGKPAAKTLPPKR